MNRRLLIVSPHFPPTNAPDMQRARQCLPYLASLGWDAEVLAVDPQDVAAPADPLLLKTLPDLPIHRVRVLPLSLGSLLGLGSLGLRARHSLGRAGDELFRARKFDLIFFTTTQFIILTLGPVWRRKFGVPYVVDWQDPWVTDYYDRPGAPPPPGGWKYRFAAGQARRSEGPCLRQAIGLVSTSQDYVDQLRTRYPWFADTPTQVNPFGVDPADLEVAQDPEVPAAFVRQDGVRHFVYVGAVGQIMRPALELLFAGVRDHLAAAPAEREKIRLYFIGTSYAPNGQGVPSVLPIATAAGVADVVTETTGRIGHFAALKTMLAADALFLLGSDDLGYSPSKIATLALTGKPVLAIIPGSGQLEKNLLALKFARVARFSPSHEIAAVRTFLAAPSVASPLAPGGSAPALTGLMARERTRELAEFFSRALDAAASLPKDPPST